MMSVIYCRVNFRHQAPEMPKEFQNYAMFSHFPETATNPAKIIPISFNSFTLNCSQRDSWVRNHVGLFKNKVQVIT